MADLSKVFGDLVRAHRTAKGITQAQLADASGLSEEWVRRVERGEGSPSFETIEQISAQLGVSPPELFGGRPLTDDLQSEKLTMLLAILARRSSAELKWIAGLVAFLDERPKS